MKIMVDNDNLMLYDTGIRCIVNQKQLLINDRSVHRAVDQSRTVESRQ